MKQTSYRCTAKPLGIKGPSCGGSPAAHNVITPTVRVWNGERFIDYPMHNFEVGGA